MQLKCINLNGEIVLGRKLNHVELLFLKNCKNYIQKWILQVIFSKRCSNCPKNKIVHNFFITNPNGMNQSFTCRKNIFYEKQNSIFFFQIFKFFCFPLSHVLSLFRHNFCCRAPIEKRVYSSEDNLFFYLQKKFQKSWQKFSP